MGCALLAVPLAALALWLAYWWHFAEFYGPGRPW